MKIGIVQPALPDYRVDFYDQLSSVYHVEIYSNHRDFLGVNSVYFRKNVFYGRGFFRFGSFYWHKKLPLTHIVKEYDVIIVPGNAKVLNYLLLMFLAKFHSTAVIWWGHGRSRKTGGFRSLIKKSTMYLADAVMLYVKDEKKYYNGPKFFYASNGLKKIKDADYKRKIFLKKDGFLNLVFIGRVTNKSNLFFLLNTIAIYKIEFVRLTVIGDGDLVVQYKQFCLNSQISGRVKWVGSLFDENKIGEILEESDFFIYTGSVGLSLIHAFNYGLPAILHSNENLHMPEFSAFRNEVNGLSYEYPLHDSLYRVLFKAYSLSNESWLQMSTAALGTVKSEFNTDVMVGNFAAAIEYAYHTKDRCFLR